MKIKQTIAVASILLLSISGRGAVLAVQDAQYRMAHANGDGKLKVGQEEFKVNGVIVKLLNDKTAEITLISDITFFITGTWSQDGTSKEDFDLQITGGASPGGLDGAGKLTLGKDGPSNVRLTLKGKSRTTKKNIELNFVGK